MKSTALVFLVSITCLGCAKRNFFAPTPLTNFQAASPALPYSDSVTVQAGKHYAHGRIFSLMFGKHYRPVWAAPIRVRVLHLQDEKGGLHIGKIGGSMQSTSFTLRAKDGLEYALRTVDKDPARSLPAYLQKTIVASFLRDQTAALNPYAALVVAPLAEAAGIMHTNPGLVYLPADSVNLGKYLPLAGDKLYMLEEKMDHKRAVPHDTTDLDDVVSTKKLLKKRFRENDHHVDQAAFAKARLFDIFLNDRDRHEGQWNWAKYKKGGINLYVPIPKDRDQAFYRFAGGLIPRVVGRGLNFQKFISFRKDFNDLVALTHKSEYLDKHFLSEVTQETFDSLAVGLQASLTDEVIEGAVRALPEAAHNLIGENMAATLRSRRDLLPDVAKAYYKFLAHKASVVGSDEKEHFIIKRLDAERTAVTVLDSEDSAVLFHRIFNRNETKEIEVFGLGKDDVFEVSGEVEKGIKIILYGGSGEDKITDTSKVRGWKKMTIVRDTPSGNQLTLGSETRYKPSADVAVNAFDREGN